MIASLFDRIVKKAKLSRDVVHHALRSLCLQEFSSGNVIVRKLSNVHTRINRSLPSFPKYVRLLSNPTDTFEHVSGEISGLEDASSQPPFQQHFLGHST